MIYRYFIPYYQARQRDQLYKLCTLFDVHVTYLKGFMGIRKEILSDLYVLRVVRVQIFLTMQQHYIVQGHYLMQFVYSIYALFVSM